MNRSSLRNERLKFETLGKDLPIVLEESSEYPRMRDKKNQKKISTCNRWDLEGVGS